MPAGTHSITATYTGDSNYGLAASAPITVAADPVAHSLIVEEFRLYGPGGAGDQYVDLYNNTGAQINMQGWYLASTVGGVVGYQALPDVAVPAHASYLVAGSQYSLRQRPTTALGPPRSTATGAFR